MTKKEQPKHVISFEQGSDANNHKALCSCGWGHSNTKRSCEKHAEHHTDIASKFLHKWTDSNRPYVNRYYEELEH